MKTYADGLAEALEIVMERGDDAGYILLHKSLVARGEPVTEALDTEERRNFFKRAYTLYRAKWLSWVDTETLRL